MTTTEQRELELFILEHVLKWDRVEHFHELENCRQFLLYEDEFYVLCGTLLRAQKWTLTDPAAAMLVLEKCCQRRQVAHARCTATQEPA